MNQHKAHCQMSSLGWAASVPPICTCGFSTNESKCCDGCLRNHRGSKTNWCTNPSCPCHGSGEASAPQGREKPLEVRHGSQFEAAVPLIQEVFDREIPKILAPQPEKRKACTRDGTVFVGRCPLCGSTNGYALQPKTEKWEEEFNAKFPSHPDFNRLVDDNRNMRGQLKDFIRNLLASQLQEAVEVLAENIKEYQHEQCPANNAGICDSCLAISSYNQGIKDAIAALEANSKKV